MIIETRMNAEINVHNIPKISKKPPPFLSPFANMTKLPMIMPSPDRTKGITKTIPNITPTIDAVWAPLVQVPEYPPLWTYPPEAPPVKPEPLE